MATRQIGNETYHMSIQPPPGLVVAPDGFPAAPRPINAPKTFLDAMDIRIKVFCDEQHCAIEPELDEDDAKSWSWVVYRSGHRTEDSKSEPRSEEPVSTVRFVPPPHPPHPNGYVDEGEEPYVKLTRVATVQNARRKGLSKWLIDAALEFFASHPTEVAQDWKGLVLTHAQVDVEGMYQRIGFVTDDKLGRWDEEGIEHLGMWKRVDVKAIES